MATTVLGVDIQSILACLSAFLVLLWWLRRPKNLPPGPWGWPLVGYLPNLLITLYRTGLHPHQVFMNMSRRFGPVFSITVFGKVFVVLNKYEHIKKAFHDPRISDRPVSPVIKELGLHEGFLLSSGEAWKQQRRFIYSDYLAELWCRKKKLRRLYSRGSNIFVGRNNQSAEITTRKETSFDPRSLFTNATSNIICSVVFGKRYGYTDSNFKYLLELLNQNVQLFGAGGIELFFPLSKYLRPNNFDQLKSNLSNIVKFITDVVKKHESSRDPDNPNDYIDVYLNEIEANSNGKGRASYVNTKNMPLTVMNLFGAGTETTATTLRWSVLYMMAYPEIQKRVQDEIDSVVGPDRLPRLSDKDSLPLTSAVLLEIQRLATIAPLGVTHSCREETTLNGYTIPTGSIVMANLWASHHDPDTWENPDKFKPARFLDEDGKLLEREELIPFSIGRRICLGEHLAKMEIFIFFTHLIHQFAWTKPKDTGPLSFKGEVGLVNSTGPYLTRVVSRK